MNKFRESILICNIIDWHEEIDRILQDIVADLSQNRSVDAAVKIGCVIEKNNQIHRELLEEQEREETDDD